MVKATISVDGMLNRKIAECLKGRIQAISGVTFVETSHEKKSATVQFDQYTTDLDDIFLVIEEAGLDTK
ncbi:heavy-metal-associated domain-containing protein [Magnetovibrio sp. PR-2]|uniref:heavy-metal-associated domain-containing protein n=1 Tax=Magnetovibrio sp. PR-2 TaxID=3120356 RepID=UPI002FCE1A59